MEDSVGAVRVLSCVETPCAPLENVTRTLSQWLPQRGRVTIQRGLAAATTLRHADEAA